MPSWSRCERAACDESLREQLPIQVERAGIRVPVGKSGNAVEQNVYRARIAKDSATGCIFNVERQITFAR
jgi:hypothetical protein